MEEIIIEDYDPGDIRQVKMHDGSTIILKKTDSSYVPTLRSAAMRYLEAHSVRGEVITGLLFLNQDLPIMHDIEGTATEPLATMDVADLIPGSTVLAELQKGLK